MIWDFINVFSNIRSKQHFYADDGTDKLNRSMTVIFLIIAALLIGARQLVGPTIVCLDDPHRTSTLTIDYAQHVCWAKNTYIVNNYNVSDSPRIEITYYQWLIFILVFLALCYYIPYLIWKSLLRSNFASIDQIPVDLCGIINTLKETKIYRLKDFNAAIKDIVEYLNNCFIYNSIEYRQALKSGNFDYDEINGRLTFIKMNDNFHKISTNSTKSNNKKTSKAICCCRNIFSYHGSCLIIKYLFIKLIYIAISISVFWFLNLFLNFKDGYNLYGFKMFYNLTSSKSFDAAELWKSPHFPREVYCDLQIRVDPINVHTNRIPCSLPANVFNEKIFIFLWFWFMIIAILNCISFIKWIYIIISRKQFISKYLKMSVNNINNNNNSFIRYESNDARLINLFITNYLQYDGYFILLIIKSNLNDIYFKRLIDSLWKTYSISNLDDQDLMQPTPPRITSTIGGVNSGNAASNDKHNLTSPIVVPQQPSSKLNINGQNRKFLFNDDNVSESKIKLINDDKTAITGNDDSDYFNNETQQQPTNALRLQPQPSQQKQQLAPQTKSGTYVTYRKEDLV